MGLRSAYVAAGITLESWSRGISLIAFGSSFGANCPCGPGYGAQKAGIDKFAHDMQHDLSETIAPSIWMGPLRTGRA